ncbi:MAG TPA: adenosylcobinamide-phosphate synthase CbiB [Polaromonas sp.]|nr:adenosylcobinamide-phosphate synthase CbiB [Polaromonas sp.]HYW55427.1 adenosylcobinamide-phosphate synthase CbiB [Polaromonas sp.]
MLLLPVLLLALWLDRTWGEPRAAFHPVVWMGHYLTACGRITAVCRPLPAFVGGTIAWCAGALAVGALSWMVQGLLEAQFVRLTAVADVQAGVSVLLLLALMAWLLKCMLSWRMLRREVLAVEEALQQSPQAGRERLSWLVSRDTSQLTESEVRQSAIESLAENLNDSVVAPVFWFVLLGLPGAAVYRFANTADAMWGYRGIYKGQNWKWAGKWAARSDDVLSWVPARLTALLMWLVSRGFKFAALHREAARTPSPNSGWPMAGIALALNVHLSKPGVYTLNEAGRAPGAADTQLAVGFASKVLHGLLLCATIAIVLIAVTVK